MKLPWLRILNMVFVWCRNIKHSVLAKLHRCNWLDDIKEQPSCVLWSDWRDKAGLGEGPAWGLMDSRGDKGWQLSTMPRWNTSSCTCICTTVYTATTCIHASCMGDSIWFANLIVHALHNAILCPDYFSLASVKMWSGNEIICMHHTVLDKCPWAPTGWAV